MATSNYILEVLLSEWNKRLPNLIFLDPKTQSNITQIQPSTHLSIDE